MKLSPPFARNEYDRVSLCLNEKDEPVVVTDEFRADAIDGFFGGEAVLIKVEPYITTVYVPSLGLGLPERLSVQLQKYQIGSYVARFGVAHVGKYRVIAYQAALDKIPPRGAL